MLKIIEKKGIYQIEDWGETDGRLRHIVGCYPRVTKNASPLWPRLGEKVRISIICKDMDEAKEIFDNLAEGRKAILDYKSVFYDQTKAQYIE